MVATPLTSLNTVWSTTIPAGGLVVTVKLRCTGGAGVNEPLPAWSAWIVHVPAVSNVTDVPETVHTAGVDDENDTGSPTTPSHSP